MKNIKRIKELITTLNKARYEYYQNNNEIMSNYEYDKLFDELMLLESKTRTIFNNSPTIQVGYKTVSKLEKVKHINPLLSLDKTKSVDDLNNFRKNKPSLLMYKLDGLTVELKYENGVLVQGQTRGNGEIGELITHNVKTFVNVPMKINYKGTLRVVGEAVIDYNTFNQINTDENTEYKNPRNLASGTVRQLDSKICANRNVKFYVFGINEGLEGTDSKHETFLELKAMGFEICPYFAIDVKDNNIQEILDYVPEKEKTLPIDGMVMTYDSKSYSNSLGITSHHPKHSVAFKWSDTHAETILRDILVDVGKSGQVSYTACFDPVELEGTVVEKATLHNYDYIKSLELGIGDTIHVIKSNMIIPQVVENLTRSGIFKKVEICPICGSKLVHKGVHQFCENYNCERQIVGRLVHWCSRDAMNIEGMSEETIKAIRQIENFEGENILSNVADIYALPKNKCALLELDGFGKRKVDKLCAAIEKSKTMPLSNVIYGLSIPQVGKKASKLLCEKFSSIDALNNDISYKREVQEIIGESCGKSFCKHFFSSEIIKVIDLLKAYGLTMVQPIEEQSNIQVTQSEFTGLKIYATGSFKNYKKKEIKAKLESLGAIFANGYAKSLDCLLVGGLKGSSKVDKAIKDGIRVITEDEFEEMIK